MGYGDYTPQTTTGKFLTILCSVVGIVLVSIMIISIQAVFTLSERQAEALKIKGRIDFSKKFKKISACFFQANFKFLFHKRRYLELFKSQIKKEQEEAALSRFLLIEATYDKCKFKSKVRSMRQWLFKQRFHYFSTKYESN